MKHDHCIRLFSLFSRKSIQDETDHRNHKWQVIKRLLFIWRNLLHVLAVITKKAHEWGHIEKKTIEGQFHAKSSKELH